MSNPYQNSMNAAQLNPALLQAMAQHGAMNGQGGKPDFQSFHQAFARIQSQESQKADQQRLGLGTSQQGQASIGNNANQTPQQQQQSQQFIHMMQMMQNQQNQNGQNSQNGMNMGQNGQNGFDLASLQGMANGNQQSNMSMSRPQGNLQQGLQPNVQQNIQSMLNLGMLGSKQGDAASGNGGLNIHSQQQGLSFPGMPDNEQARRQILQTMLSQQLQSQQPGQQINSSQFQNPQLQQANQNQRPASQLPQHLQGQAQQNLGQGQSLSSVPAPNNGPVQNLSVTSEKLREFMRTHPEIVKQMQERQPNNHAALLSQLNQMAFATSDQQGGQQSGNGMAGQQGLGQTQNQMTQQQSFTSNQNQQSQQGSSQFRPSPQPQHQRTLSTTSTEDFRTFQNLQGMNQLQNMGGIDPKQMEALQAMKAAQLRTGLVTPSIKNNNLPTVSPQTTAQIPAAANLGQGNLNQQQRQMSQTSSFQLGQMPPPPQRSASQTSVNPVQNMAQAMLNANQNNQTQNAQGNPGDVSGMIMRWNDETLLKNTGAVVQKLQKQIQQLGGSPATDPTKYHLVQIIAEWKRRAKPIPNDVLQVAGQALGAPNMLQSLAGADWMQLCKFAKGRLDAMQEQRTNQQAQMPNQQAVRPPMPPSQNPNSGPGSQSNPIEIGTPVLQTTPQLPNQTSLPNAFQTPQQIGLQPPAQINESGQQRPGPSQAPVRPGAQPQQGQQPSQSQLNVQRWQQQQMLQQQQNQQQQQQQLLQQQQQQQQQTLAQQQSNVTQKQQNSAGPAKPKPWLGMDFRSEPIPIEESRFWQQVLDIYYKSRPGSDNNTLSPPRIEGKPVNLFVLFTLVHRNGGSAKVANNPDLWSYMGGHLGFGTTQSTSGQPSKCTPLIADQLRQLYQHLLQQLEDMFYHRLYSQRVLQASQASQSQAGEAQNAQQGQNQNQSQVPNAPQGPLGISLGSQGMSAQFLEAVAKAPAGTLTDQQKKMLEEARRLSLSSQASQSQSQQTPNIQTPAQLPNSNNANQALPANANVIAQVAAAKNNPALLYSLIRQKEDLLKQKFPHTKPQQIADDEKPRLVAEIRALLPAAREAQEKAPRFFAIAAEIAPEEAINVNNLISYYTFVFLTQQHAEAGRFPLGLPELSKIRDQLNNLLFRLNTFQKKACSTPDGANRIQQVLSAMDLVQAPSASQTMPPPSVPSAAPDDMASKLPKGLRVEDLKPPPAKRQRGGAANKQAAGASPASSNVGATPEAARTPANMAPSPAQSGTTSAKKGNAGNKRKRQASVNKTPKSQQTDAKAEGTATPGTAANIKGPEPAKNNALGINIDAVELEIQENAAFFTAYENMRNYGDKASLSKPGSDDSAAVFAALSSALAEYSASYGSTNVSVDPKSGLSAIGDDELFAQFIDVPKADDEAASAWTLPTPELFRGSFHHDEDSDTSPESIKTVGSTTGTFGIGKTPAGAGPTPTPTTKDIPATGQNGLTAILGGEASPENQAYNGSIFSGWNDEFDFGTTAA